MAVDLETPESPRNTRETFWLRLWTWIATLAMPENFIASTACEWLIAREMRSMTTVSAFDGPLTQKQALFLDKNGMLLVFAYPSTSPSHQTVYELNPPYRQVTANIKRRIVDSADFMSMVKHIYQSDSSAAASLYNYVYPNIPDDDQIDRWSKTDNLSRTVVWGQMFWFSMHLITRLGQTLEVSLLEIVTAAYVVLFLLAYPFTYKTPYNIP